MARLTIENLTKTFGTFKALKNVSLDVADGEFLAVLGPSGCGKTTLLRMIAGFEKVTEGRIAIDGAIVSSPEREVAPEDRKIGIVFQNYALWPHMSVADNIGYSLKVGKVGRAEREHRVKEALGLVNMQQFADRRPASLSGGQRQRVALARCLVAEPKLVLFDEPLANLDVHLRAAMEDEFAAFHERAGTTVVYITHDQAEAMALADRIAVMDHGRLMQLATPYDLYHKPANRMVASFISQGIILPATVLSSEADEQCRVSVLGQELIARCQPGEQPRDTAAICCRAQQIEPAAAGEPGIDGIVKRTIYRGGVARVEFEPEANPELAIHFDQPDPVTFTAGMRACLRITSGWLIPENGGV
ncbi:MAG TPA: ABC transporter ATP-binding protein [Pararhizobium sp.]|nr:ABC transporter ATP-binding protein [Pararhizobium sp.]